jgi:squalene-associated FAD-dependent desaturase
VRPNAGPLAWWVLAPDRRPPGTRAADYLPMLRLLRARDGRRLDQVIRCEGPLWERLMRPLLLAALNTDPEIASAGLAAAVLRESLARGEAACRPRIAAPSLAAAFVDPALGFLTRRGATVRFGRRLRGLVVEGDRVGALELADGRWTVAANQGVILATPPWVTAALLPGLTAPDRFEAVVNAHFRLAPPPGGPAMVGVIGGAAEWVFAYPDRLAVTVSAAERLVEADRETLARAFWRDIRAVHGLGPELPPWQIVKERRATFAALPEQARRRPGARTPLKNLLLAGDWTDTGLPATIEGAVRSGHKAAGLAADFLQAA